MEHCLYRNPIFHIGFTFSVYLSTPDTLKMDGKRKADVENWIAVQTVFHQLKPDSQQVLTEVYKASHRLPEGVRMYCEKTGTDEHQTWVFITKVVAAIARRRGLV